MKFWQLPALVSGTIIASAMALASISYNGTLGTNDLAFDLLPITNRHLFQALALAFDLGMTASVFGFWYWYGRNRIAAGLCAALFVIASLFCVHSVHGYIRLNVTSMQAPAQRDQELYVSLKHELREGQDHLKALHASLLRARGRRRKRLLQEIRRQGVIIGNTRKALSKTSISVPVSPITGMEWFLALILWFFNATCWTAWFGTRELAPASTQELSASAKGNPDTVSDWLAIYDGVNPAHCRALHKAYAKWCEQQECNPLPRYSFYARLTELGARKFRDGRNGPTMYELPKKQLPKAA